MPESYIIKKGIDFLFAFNLANRENKRIFVTS